LLQGAIVESTDASAALVAIAGRQPVTVPTVVVVAHPDDETVGIGGQLTLFQSLTLVQLTDGAPRDGRDAKRAGYTTRRAYAAEREREARNALSRLKVGSCRRVRYRIPDQEVVLRLDEVVRALERDLGGAGLVFTHPYEGGHPDHDAAALAVGIACAALRRATGTSPQRLEFACYHYGAGQMVTGRFWPDATCTETSVRLAADARARKREALACYVTQSPVIAHFDPDMERFRRTPRYDFRRAPPPGTALYDLFGWRMNSRDWQKHAGAVLERPVEQVACGD
jgi:LmbE family N-acetylglucosaminyl deacetylase